MRNTDHRHRPGEVSLRRADSLLVQESEFLAHRRRERYLPQDILTWSCLGLGAKPAGIQSFYHRTNSTGVFRSTIRLKLADLSDMLSAISRAKDEVVDAAGYRALALAMAQSCGPDAETMKSAEM